MIYKNQRVCEICLMQVPTEPWWPCWLPGTVQPNWTEPPRGPPRIPSRTYFPKKRSQQFPSGSGCGMIWGSVQLQGSFVKVGHELSHIAIWRILRMQYPWFHIYIHIWYGAFRFGKSRAAAATIIHFERWHFPMEIFTIQLLEDPPCWETSILIVGQWYLMKIHWWRGMRMIVDSRA